MIDKWYWIIDYEMLFLSDCHVGAGVTILGGNHHGLHTDPDGYPCMTGTEVRGLMRQGGFKLAQWGNNLGESFEKNFGRDSNAGKTTKGFWSYTSARILNMSETKMYKGQLKDILGEQSHIHVQDSRLFSCQKVGLNKTAPYNWQGRIYSVEPVAESDVGFFLSSIRVEDRIGHRRSRGYGKVNWKIKKVRRYEPGTTIETVDKDPVAWFKAMQTGGVKHES